MRCRSSFGQLLVLALAFCAILPNRQTECASPPHDRYRVAIGAVRDELWEIGKAEFEALLRDHPNSQYTPDATYYLGLCGFQVGDFGRSRDHLSAYVSKWPKGEHVTSANYYLGRSLLEMRDLASAIPALRKAASTDSDLKTPASFWLGRAFFEMSEWAQAKEALQTVLDRGGANYRDAALYELARVYAQQEEHKQSIDIASRLISSTEDALLIAQGNLIVASGFLELGDFDESIKHAHSAISLAPDDSPVRVKSMAVIADAYHRAGKFEMALSAFRAYLKVRPQSRDATAWAAENIVECLTSLAQCHEAQASLTKWAGEFSDETFSDLAVGISDCYTRTEEIEAAEKTLEFAMETIKSDPVKLLVALRLADRKFKQSKFDEVIPILSPLLDVAAAASNKDQAASLMLLLGTSYDRLHAFEGARNVYSRLLSAKPGEPWSRLAGRGIVDSMIRQGDIDGAVRTLEEMSRGSQLDAEWVELAAILVDALSKRGDAAHADNVAEAAFQRITRQSPGDAEDGTTLLEVFLKELSSRLQCRTLLALADTAAPAASKDQRASLLLAAAECKLLSGEEASASTIYHGIVDSFPDWHDAHVALSRLGTIAYQDKNYDEASRLFKEARSRAPRGEACSLSYMSAESLFRAGNLSGALVEFEQIVTQQDCQAQILQRSLLRGGIISEELGMFEKARAAYELCVSMSSDQMAASIAKARLARLAK